jgi:hypothetical protein
VLDSDSLDQTKLPLEETYVLATDYKQVATGIRDMIAQRISARDQTSSSEPRLLLAFPTCLLSP